MSIASRAFATGTSALQPVQAYAVRAAEIVPTRSSGDTSVRLWDTEPVRKRYQARRAAEALRPDAERLVEELFREKKDSAEVVAAVRADRSLGEPRRHAALRAVLRRSVMGSTS